MEIPEITINENKVVLPILEVPIKVNGEDKIVKMQKISSGKRKDVLKRFIKTSVIGQQVNAEVQNILELQIAMLAQIIIESPFGKTEQEIGNLPDNVVDYLYSEYENWNKKKQQD